MGDVNPPPPLLSLSRGVCLAASLLALFAWVVHCSVTAARPLRYTLPTFLDTPVNVTAYRGTDVDLPCAVTNLGPKHVVWRKYNHANPLTVGDYVYDPDKSLEVIRPPPPNSPHWNLRITDVQIKHAGIYECQISTKEHFTRNITLTVIDAQTPFPPVRKQHDGTNRYVDDTRIKLEGNPYIEKGRPLILNCTATGFDYLPKGVDWFKDGSKIKSDAHVLITESSHSNNVLHSTLEILRSNMTDAGTYVCRSSKLNVASRRVIVLNTGSSNQRRSNGDSKDEDITQGQPHSRHQSPEHDKGSSGCDCHSSTPLSFLLLHSILCWIAFKGLTHAHQRH